MTYHAYAAALLTEHGLRIGHEPDTRLIADASRYQLAARAVQRHTQPVEQLTDHPPTVVQNLLALDGQLSEHLVTPDQLRSLRRRRASEVRGRDGRRAPQDLPRQEREGDLGHRPPRRAARPGRGLPRAEAPPRADGLLRPDLPGGPARRAVPRGRRDRARQVQGRAARRVPRHLGRPGADAEPAVLRPRRRAGLGHPVTAVGDPNQAIYGWRGASVSNILEFGRDFPPAAGAGTTYPLTVNRRSDERILATANHLAADLYAAPAGAAAARAEARCRARRGPRRRPRDLRRRARVARRARSSPPTPISRHAPTSPAGARSACSRATTRTPPPSSTR